MNQQFPAPGLPDMAAMLAALQRPAGLNDAIAIPGERLADIQQQFVDGWRRLCDDAAKGQLPALKDKRFAAPAWVEAPASAFMAHAYLHMSATLRNMADSVQGTPAVRQRIRFAVDQWIAASAPSNFLAFNPDALRRVVDTQGESLRAGINNLMTDLRKGRLSQTDESGFVIGENIATTAGSVVFENRFFQLIQYAPTTPTVHTRPLLIVPPCINKFYILDLQASSSLAAHAVQAGFTVFMISWRNPLATDTDGIQQATWDDYLEEGVLAAIDTASRISGQGQINTLGFCVGGTMLASALAVARARGEDPAASVTLLTTLLDFSDTGVLDVFVDDAHVQFRERLLGQGGLLTAGELASTFSFLRPDDLVWNYVVANYLKGQTPPAFDLLYWNADSTNLPGPFYTWYLRNTYLENRMREPGALTCCGQPLDLGKLDMPAYVFGSREDHIVPWQSAYASVNLLRGPRRFVLGASGHIAGVINPPAKKKRSHWLYEGDEVPSAAADWLAGATELPGSWWDDWTAWLSTHSGEQRKARKTLGNAQFKPIEPAPGRYVRVRAT